MNRPLDLFLPGTTTGPEMPDEEISTDFPDGRHTPINCRQAKTVEIWTMNDLEAADSDPIRLLRTSIAVFPGRVDMMWEDHLFEASPEHESFGIGS